MTILEIMVLTATACLLSIVIIEAVNQVSPAYEQCILQISTMEDIDLRLTVCDKLK